jgi:hypothetical protein
MSHGLKIAIVGTLLVVVMFVVVHPLVDLQPTVLRSLQTSFLGLAALVIAVALATGLVRFPSGYLATDTSHTSHRKDHLSRLDLTCTCLC